MIGLATASPAWSVGVTALLAHRKESVVSMTSIIDAIEGGGWRQEIRRELLCKLQQKLTDHRLARRPISANLSRWLFEIRVHDSDFVHTTACQIYASVGRGRHVSHHSTAGWNSGAGKFLGRWIEFDYSVGFNPGLAVPHAPVLGDCYPIRAGFGPSGRSPHLDRTGRWI